MFRRITQGSLIVGLLVLAASERAGAIDLQGSGQLSAFVQEVLDECSAPSLEFVGGTSDSGERALLDEGLGVPGAEQRIAPMTRPLALQRTCQHPTPQQAEDRILALEANVLVVDQQTATGCQGEAVAVPLAVEDTNGEAGLDCPGCSDGVYELEDWRDSLRVALAGIHHDGGTIDCNSDVRHSLSRDLAALLSSECATSGCEAAQHLFRPEDRNTEVLRMLLDLPEGVSFCNGTTLDDRDPVRRSCLDGEQVCSADGTLGFLLPIAEGQAFPTQACATGAFGFRSAPLNAVSSCVDGTQVLFGLCLVPLAANGNANCLNSKDNVSVFALALPEAVDGRAYNLELRHPDGNLRTSAFGQQRSAAFERIHSSAFLTGGERSCRELDPSQQLGCLSQASPCSLAMGGLLALEQVGVTSLPVAGISPTPEAIRLALSEPLPPEAYPLSQPVFLSTMVGFDELALGSPQRALSTCFGTTSEVQAAAEATGLTALAGAPICRDFDETACPGALPLNKDNCRSIINRCPIFDAFFAAPLTTTIGGTVQLAATVIDPDDERLTFLWTADAGSFEPELETVGGVPVLDGAEFSHQSTYTCEEPGDIVLTLRAWDGSCDSPPQRFLRQVTVTCNEP